MQTIEDAKVAQEVSGPLKESFGVLYVTTGERHFEEALLSAKSVRECMPNIGIAIVTDQIDKSQESGLFHHIIPIEPDGTEFGIKWLGMKLTPFPKTLFLDSDTYALAPVYELIDLLDDFDFAAAHDEHRFSEFEPVPYCYSEFNSGVVAYRKTPLTLEVMDQIYETYLEKFRDKSRWTLKRIGDQGAVRRVFYERKDVRVCALTPEYNLRAYTAWFAVGRVRIVHARGEFLRKAIRKANIHSEARTGDGLGFFRRKLFIIKHMMKPYIPAKYYRRIPRSFEFAETKTSLDTSKYQKMT